MDSLQTIELVYQVESVFDLQIPDEDFGRLRTIGDVLTYLIERTGSTHNHVLPPHVSTKAKKPKTNSTIQTKPRSRSKTSPPMNSSIPSHTNPIPLEDLAQSVQATIHGSSEVFISGLSHLEGATCGDLSFVLKPKLYEAARKSQAAAFLTTHPFPDDPRPQLICSNPMLAIVTLAQKYFLPPLPPRGIHPTAVTGHDVRIGPDVSIGPLVTIGDRAEIGSGVTIYAGVHIGDDAIVGDDCVLYPHVSLLTNCILGNRVILHSGTVIGSDGFGYAQHEGRHHKIPQLGNVLIEDDVELGANVSVDRATFGSTIIKQGTKIDNQVQIAHNVTDW